MDPYLAEELHSQRCNNTSRALIIIPETESSAKKERMVCDSGRDRLSELPSCIIDIILSSVSTKDAVRTSILSRQFRYTWTNLPHLVFDISEFTSIKCMRKFVTNVLKLHKGPIHKFSLSVMLKKNWPIVDACLLLLPTNEIRELTIKLSSVYKWLPPQSVVGSIAYSCNKLTRLELFRSKVNPPPLTFTGFLFLRCLILRNAYISFTVVKTIVDSSPLLETLKLDSCACNYHWPELRISAPNLKYLEIESYPGDCTQIYLRTPLLAEASIRIKIDGETSKYLREYRSTYNHMNIFGGCGNLQILRSNYFSKVMSYGIDSSQYSFDLPCLKVIELDYVNLVNVKEMSFVVQLMTGAPNLEKLELTFFDAEEQEQEVESSDASYMDFVRARNFKWEKLRIITIRNLLDLPSEIELFLKHLLENSPALERMNLHTPGIDFQEVTNLRAKVLKWNLASPNFTLSTRSFIY